MELQALLALKSADEVLADLLAHLPQDFGIDDWHDGGVVRTLLELDAHATADMGVAARAIAASGFLETATGGWLDKVAWNRFGVRRQPSVVAKYRLRLELAAGYGPETIQPGQLWGSDGTGLLFNNLHGATIARGEAIELEFVAERAGAQYNVPIGTITTLVTPLPGLSVHNDAHALLRAGADEESDAALRQRCRLRWALLGRGATKAAYEYWAFAAHPSISKVQVRDNHPRGQGTLDVVLHGDGGLGAEIVTEADAYIQARRALNDDVRVMSARERVIAYSAVLRGDAAFAESAIAEAQRNSASFQRALPIGAVVYRHAIVELMMLPVGVADVVLDVRDVYLADDEVAILQPTIRFEALG